MISSLNAWRYSFTIKHKLQNLKGQCINKIQIEKYLSYHFNVGPSYRMKNVIL